MSEGQAPTAPRVPKALSSALVAAGVVAALCFPVVAYLALPGAGGDLALQSRWTLVAQLALAVFALTLLVAGAGWLSRTKAAGDARAERDSALASIAKYVPKGGLAALLLYPAFVVGLAGWPGAIKYT